MRIITDYGTNENQNPILNAKMKSICSYDDFLQLVENEKYGWLPCVAAFHKVWRFDEDWVEDQFIEFFFDELLSSAVENVLQKHANTDDCPLHEKEIIHG